MRRQRREQSDGLRRGAVARAALSLLHELASVLVQRRADAGDESLPLFSRCRGRHREVAKPFVVVRSATWLNTRAEIRQHGIERRVPVSVIGERIGAGLEQGVHLAIGVDGAVGGQEEQRRDRGLTRVSAAPAHRSGCVHVRSDLAQDRDLDRRSFGQRSRERRLAAVVAQF